MSKPLPGISWFSRFGSIDFRAASRQPTSVWFVASVGVGTLLWLLLGEWLVPYISDDAFIFFRHVKHHAQGLGFVWDQANPVEGYSSPLWAVLLRAMMPLGLSIPVASVVLGIACCVLSAMLLAYALDALTERWVAVVGCLVFVTFPGTFLWARAGLETMLAVLCGLLFMLLLSRQLSADAPADVGASKWLLVALCLFAVTIRSDFPHQVVGACVILLFMNGRLRDLWWPALAGIVGLILYMCLRKFVLYGEWVSLPQLAKSHFEPINVLRFGRYFLSHGPFLLFFSLIGLIWRLVRRRDYYEIEAVALAFGVIQLAEYAALGGDELVRGRFLISVTACMVLCLARPVAELFRASGAVFRWGVLACCAIGLGVQIQTSLTPTSDGLSSAYRKAAGLWLKRHTASDFSFATIPAGYVPYFAERNVVDLYGLNHKKIARLQAERGGVEYGYQAASIAHQEGVCAFYLVVGVTAKELSCQSLTTPHHSLVKGVVSFLKKNGGYAYVLATLRGKHGPLPLFVRKRCLSKIKKKKICSHFWKSRR